MEIIRSVETIRGKIKISFESGWQVWLRRNEQPGFPLTEGTTIDKETFIKYILLHQYPSALDRAVRMLSERQCSKREIERRLYSARYDSEVIDLVLYKLEKEKLLDDIDFAGQWVQSRSRKYGSARIYRELRMKGIDADTAESVLESLSDEEQAEHAVTLAAKKIRSLQDSCDSSKLKHRVVNSLIRRGYTWDIALQAYEEASQHKE